MRWQQFRKIWIKGKIYIVVRPACKNHLVTFFKEEVKELNVMTLSRKFNLNNSYMVFEGITSAIREHSRKASFR